MAVVIFVGGLLPLEIAKLLLAVQYPALPILIAVAGLEQVELGVVFEPSQHFCNSPGWSAVAIYKRNAKHVTNSCRMIF